MVAITTVKTEDGDLSLKTPEGAVINISINQRSALDGLLDAIRSTRTERKAGQEASPPGEEKPPGETRSALLLGTGVSLLSLGCFTIMLAILLTAAQVQVYFMYGGTLFWVGIPYFVFGVMNIVACRSPKTFWAVIAFIGLLVCLGVSIAGIVRVADDCYRPYMGNICDELREGNKPSYDDGRSSFNYDNDWRVGQCKRNLQSFGDTKFGLTIICMLLMIWGLCVVVVTIGCRLKAFCAACKCEKLEEEKDDPLLSPKILIS